MDRPTDLAIAIYGSEDTPTVDLASLWSAVDAIDKENKDYPYRRDDCKAFRLRFLPDGMKAGKTYEEIASLVGSGNAQAIQGRVNRVISKLRRLRYRRKYQVDLGVIECPSCHHRFKPAE